MRKTIKLLSLTLIMVMSLILLAGNVQATTTKETTEKTSTEGTTKETTTKETGTTTENSKETTEKITISKSSATVKVGETLTLTAKSSLDEKITWSSNDKTIATVDTNGKVKGVKEGKVTITAKGKEKTATCAVTVEAKEDSTSSDKETSDDVKWTDFSKAKFELKKGLGRLLGC